MLCTLPTTQARRAPFPGGCEAFRNQPSDGATQPVPPRLITDRATAQFIG